MAAAVIAILPNRRIQTVPRVFRDRKNRWILCNMMNLKITIELIEVVYCTYAMNYRNNVSNLGAVTLDKCHFSQNGGLLPGRVKTT